MTIEEFYALAGGDAADTLRRLGSEATVRRFALRYAADGTHDALRRALAADDRPAAFRAAHTLKGTAANLGFTALTEAAGVLTETLRAGNVPAPGEIEAVEKAQCRVVAAVAGLRDG